MIMVVVHKAGCVIRLYDDYTKKSLKGNFHIQTLPAGAKVLKKSTEEVVYSYPLVSGTEFNILSDHYMTESITLPEDASDDFIPYMEVYMKPSTKYPFREGDTLVRFKIVSQEKEQPVGNAAVQGHVLSKDDYLGRLNEDLDCQGGEKKKVNISLVNRDLVTKQYYTVIEGEKSALFQVIEKTEAGYVVEFVDGKGGCFGSGSLVCPGIYTVTDSNGHGMIYFRSIKSEVANFRLLLSKGQKSKELKGQFEDQKMINLGQLTL